MEHELQILKKLLEKARGEDTCFPLLANGWNKGNPSYGQGCVTSLLVNESFGGDIIFTTAILPDRSEVKHYYNSIDGEDLDLTWHQFPEGTTKGSKEMQTIDHILNLPDNEKQRYELLKRRIGASVKGIYNKF